MEWSWSPYGTDHSMSIPYGIYGLYGMRKWLESQLNGIPYGLHGMVHGVHGVQVHSIWINPGTVKTSHCATILIKQKCRNRIFELSGLGPMCLDTVQQF